MMHTTPNNQLLKSFVNRLRDMSLSAFEFRQIIRDIAKVLLYEAMAEHQLRSEPIPTWQGERECELLDEGSIMVVSVLRAALPMHESIIDTLPGAVSGFLGMKRDETTHESVLYYDRVGDCSAKTVILVDPMVATGGSLCDAIDVIKNKGAGAIICLNVIASPEGIAAVEAAHPDVRLFIAQVDERLSKDKFILPGLGDAGDRSFNTL